MQQRKGRGRGRWRWPCRWHPGLSGQLGAGRRRCPDRSRCGKFLARAIFALFFFFNIYIFNFYSGIFCEGVFCSVAVGCCREDSAVRTSPPPRSCLAVPLRAVISAYGPPRGRLYLHLLRVFPTAVPLAMQLYFCNSVSTFYPPVPKYRWLYIYGDTSAHFHFLSTYQFIFISLYF